MIERRITKDEVLDAPVSAYTEGNTRVIPIVEEVWNRKVSSCGTKRSWQIVKIKIQVKGDING